MAISQRRMTLPEFLQLPEDEPALEYEAGVVKQKVSPKGPHSKLQVQLARLFDNFAAPIKLASAFTELRTTFGGDSLVPDVAVYRWERIPRDSAGRVAEDFFTPPDLAVEILSPGQSQRDLIKRCRWYVENGVQIVLHLDPRNETVLLFLAGTEPNLLTRDDLIDLDLVLPGLRLTVRELFSPLWPGQ
jgi:Uma2 family endonuclease